MRIVMVSAHFPPDFVSGGTLVPQRMARELARRGHDVHVYAGWLGGNAVPLSTWDDRDESGVAVRWIVIRPWIGWSDRYNYDNPAVADDFARYLARVRPDVVHLHSLQSFGCGLVEAAGRSGCATVVTMHDFWWVCARQFLVDRAFQPCSLVVAAGSCQCEVDRPWLEERNARLARALASVDLVLTPSALAAQVLRANGIVPDKIEVDENAVVPVDRNEGPDRQEHRRSALAGLTFVYAGGPDRMKGAEVLLDAARRLAGRAGWRIIAYGLPEGGEIAGTPIDARPPFGEHELASVLAEADVLLLPSIMRESFSILTREALSAGVPVITTDTLGPEEVIEDGKNGLIIPGADPGALADAMALLLDTPGLLERLGRGCRALPLRSVVEQATGLEARYSELLARQGRDRSSMITGQTASPSRSSRERPIRRVVFSVGIDGAPLRYRAHLPAEGLGLLGVKCDVRYYLDPELPSLVVDADAVVFYRVPATIQVLDMIEGIRRRGCPAVFDVDDLIFDPEIADEIPALSILPPAESALWLEGVRRYRTTMEACDLFVGSTTALCRHARQLTGMPVEHFANGVGLLLAMRSEQVRGLSRPDGTLRIGYFSGTTTHDRDWAYIEPAVLEILARFDNLELWLGGYVTTSPALQVVEGRVRRLDVLPWTELPIALRNVDINLAPLEPGSRFNDSKSAIKWLEAALVDTPTVASPTEPFRDAIRADETGALARSPEEWVGVLDRLLRDERQRRSMGRRARRDALLRWSPHLQGRRYLALLERAASIGGSDPQHQVKSSWVPTVLDEPPRASPLTPYALPQVIPVASDRAAGASGTLSRMLALSRRGLSVARHDGVRVALKRAFAYVRRDAGALKRGASARWVRGRERVR